MEKIDLSNIKDEDLLPTLIIQLNELTKASNYKLSIKDDTLVFLYYVIKALMVGGYQAYVKNCFSPRAFEAFNEIGAKKYAKLFIKYDNLLNDKIKNTKGIFKGFIISKYLKQLTKDFKLEWENLDSNDSLITNYINPYIKKNY